MFRSTASRSAVVGKVYKTSWFTQDFGALGMLDG